MAKILNNTGYENNPKIHYSDQSFRIEAKLFENDVDFNALMSNIEYLLVDLKHKILKGGMSKDEIEILITDIQLPVFNLRHYISNKTFNFRLKEQIQSSKVLKLLDPNEEVYINDIPF